MLRRSSGFLCSVSLALVLVFAVPLATLAAGDIHARVDELLFKKEFAAAIELASAAYAKNPDDPLAICALACAYRNSSLKSAVRVDETALGIRAGQKVGVGTITQQNVGQAFSEEIYYESPGREKTIELYHENIQKNPRYENSYYNLMNMSLDEYNPEEIVAVMRLMGQQPGLAQPASFLEYATPFFEKEDYRSALVILEGITAMFPDYAPALADAGSNYLLLGELQQGQELLARAFQLDPTDMITAKSLLSSYIYLKQFAAVSDLVAQIMEQVPAENLQPHFILEGAMATFMVDRARAKELFARFAATQEDKQGFWAWVAGTYLDLPGDTQGDFDFHAYLAGQYLENGELVYAVTETKLMKTIKPDDPLGYYYQAGGYDQVGYGPEVVQNLLFVQKYMEAHPGKFEVPLENVYYNLGRGYALQRDMANAIRYFEMSLKLKQTAVLLYNLGLSYEDLGNLLKAREYYELCSKLEDKDQLEWINKAIYKLESPKFKD